MTIVDIPHDVEHKHLQQFLTASLDRVKLYLVRSQKLIDISELNVWDQKHIDQMRGIAIVRGGKCLSDFYINNHTKLRWLCAEGHEWEATPGNIKAAGSWCPKCARRKPRSRSIASNQSKLRVHICILSIKHKARH